MTAPTLNRATHFSIVWAIMLAFLTIVEWNSLSREPMSEQILLPFIERQIEWSMAEPNTLDELGAPEGGLQTHVNIAFNGPLFLAYFFGPVLIFHAVGLLWSQLRRGG